MRLIFVLFLGLTAILAYEDVSSTIKADKAPAKVIEAPPIKVIPERPVIRLGLKPMTMVASWYGEPFHGQPTASGKIYNMYQISAAHRYFPLGTRLRLTNPKNNRSIEVEINDRGPYIYDRDLDLSFRAAFELDFTRDGVIPLKCELVYWPENRKPGA